MKTITSLIKSLTLMALLFCLTNSAVAADFYAYNGKSMTIKPGSTVGFTGYKWVLLTSPTADGRTQVQLNTDESVSDLTTTFSHPGTYTLRLSVKNGDGCWSEDTDKDISIFVLPDLVVKIDPDATTNGTYCENGTTKTTLTASHVPDVNFPLPAADVSVDLAVWYKPVAAVGDITGLTPIATSGTTYVVTDAVHGTYYYAATGKYTIAAGKLITTAADPSKSNIAAIVVTPKPTTPTITPVATN